MGAIYKKDDRLTVTITDLGGEGEGIGKVDGYTLFIKDAVIGDVVEAKIMKAKKNYAYARLEKVITPSSFRVNPKCSFAKSCGGCQLQSMSYEEQLAFKNRKVKNNLMRIGGFSEELLDDIMEEPVGMEQPFYYRNKAQFPFGYDKEGNVITGFYAGRTHSIIANTDCALGVSENKLILQEILSFLKEEKISAYKEETGEGLLRHVLIRKGFQTGQLMVCLVINGNKLPKSEKLVEKLQQIKGMTSISISINTRRDNVIMGNDIKLLWGKERIEDTIGGLTFSISPLSFFQVNPVQTENMYEQALKYADLKGEETVWDLYCGIGTISLFLARDAKQVYGVEIIPQAIEDAKENAACNQIKNAEFYVGKAEEVLPEKFKQDGIHADVIIVDPPRKGCDERCLETMVKMLPNRIVYVSCDSATLARDLSYLCANGYELKKVRAFDNFPETVHVETVVLLSQLRQKPDDYIDVDIDVAELEGTSAETKATYEKIKKYVAEHNDGMKVSSLNIAQIKRKCGLELAENFNLPKSENARQPQCPKEKEEAIVEALKAFQMI